MTAKGSPETKTSETVPRQLTILEPQPTEEKPYYVDDYPYGFRLRTRIRYWIETTNRGQRFVSQTLNPKTDRWNKPKKSVYSNILLMGLDERNYVDHTGLDMYSSQEAIDFHLKYSKYLSEHQTKEVTNIIKMLQVYDKVKVTVTTQKYKNMRTGEILTSVPWDQISDCVPCNDLGDPIDEKAEENIQNEDNRAVNKAAIINASKETSVKDALNTFKRSSSKN